MPGYDGTGPRGRGPFTGRGLGFCAIKHAKIPPDEILTNLPYGRGYGRGRGRGHRWRHRWGQRRYDE